MIRLRDDFRVPVVTIAATAIVASTLAAFAPPAPRRAGQQTTFRAQTEAAWVTATVVDKDGHVLTDLTKSDFEIRENGVVREITTFRSDPIPFALVVMVDISLSMDVNYATVHRALEELIKQFEPGDRARMGSFDALPWIADGFSSNAPMLLKSITEVIGASAPLCVGEWTGPNLGAKLLAHDGTALWDGIACGVQSAASDSETPRRVVLAISDGMENSSVLKPTEVISLADRYGVSVYSITMVGTDGVAPGDLHGISEATGGGAYALNSTNDFPERVARIADELRHQYVLGFSPQQSGGTVHGLSVRALRPDTKTRARQVYLTTAPVNAATAIVPPASSAPVATPAPARPVVAPSAPSAPAFPSASSEVVVSALERFASPGWRLGQMPRLTITQLRALLNDLKRNVPSWVSAGGPADQPRRRLAAATFVLDVLRSQDDPFLFSDNQVGLDLLDWTDGMLRGGPPPPAERQWYLAALAILERATAAAPMDRLVGKAQSRFPGDDRWALARGIAQDLYTWPEDRDATFSVHPALSSLIVSRYNEAAAFPSVHDEALLRLGYFELRRGRVDAALAAFDQVGQPQELFMRYWLHLFRGRALEQANRLDDAIASYRQAFEDVPFARSATVALCGALVLAHRQPEAERLAARMLVAPSPADPWTVYVLPDWRFWDLTMMELRRAVTP